MPAKSKTPAFDGALPQMNSLMEMSSRNLEMMAETGQEMTASMRKAGQAMSEFFGERMRKDVEAARKAAECRTPEELWRVQCAFFEEAVTDYAKEAVELIEIASSATLGAAHPVEKAAEDTLKSLSHASEKVRESVQKAVKETAQTAS
jgi:hypothetical protein